MKFADIADRIERALTYAVAMDKGDLSVIGFGTAQSGRVVKIQVYKWDDFKLLARGMNIEGRTFEGSIMVTATVEEGVEILWTKPLDSSFFDDDKDDVLSLLAEQGD